MKNINGLLSASARKYGDKTALISSRDDVRLSYNDLSANIENFSMILSSVGITENMNVAVKMKKSEYWAVMLFSLLNIGAIPVLIDSMYTERETSECLEISGTSAMICDKLMPQSAEHAVKYILFDTDSKSLAVMKGDKPAGASAIPGRKGKFSEILLFTYRGLGYPLAVSFDERSIIEDVVGNIRATKVDSGIVISDIIPSTHIFSLTTSLLSILLVGGTVVLINNIMPGEILRSLEKYSVNLIIGVPSLIKILCAAYKKKAYDLSGCVKGMIGGNSLTRELFDEWRNITKGGILVQGYGLTETSPVMCNPWKNFETLSIGKPIHGVKAKIMKDGRPVGKNREGTLFIKRKGMMKGYMNADERTSGILVKGWFDTGDIVSKEAGGFYYFHRRDKLIAKIGGVTVDLNEVKKVILSFEGIVDVQLSIEDDPIWQEKMACTIKTNKKIRKEDIIEYLRNNLTGAKIPKEIAVVNPTE